MNSLFRRYLPGLVLLVWCLTASHVLAQTVEATSEDSQLAEECRSYMIAVTPVASNAEAPTIHIVEPVENATIYGNQLGVTVEFENFDMTNGGHWHLWVDGELQVMAYAPSSVISIAPGRYHVCAILGNSEHFDLGIPDGIVVTVVEAGPGTPTSPMPALPELAVAPPEQESLVMPIILVVGIIAAGIAGWWAGRQLSRRRR